MEIKPILFNIPFPIQIFKKQVINIIQKRQRHKLFKRNIYYNLYGRKRNFLLEKKWRLVLDLAIQVREYLLKQNNKLNIRSISIFGSALYSINNGDYDFLVIVSGNKFDNFQTKINIHGKYYLVGISIKGEENLSKGIIDKEAPFEINMQNKIISRTSISLPWRHIPILGLDFKENKEIFLENCHAQIYDLLINTYRSYYLKDTENKVPNHIRDRKILSRIFEASKYAAFIYSTKELEIIQIRIISSQLNGKYGLKESKWLFKEFVMYYNKIAERR